MSTQGMSVEESNDFMALEPRLVELAKAAVAGMSPAVHVLTADDLAGVKESAQHTPAIHVIYGGYRVAESLGVAWRLAHTWYVVAAVRNVAGKAGATRARQGAGRLGGRVVAALVGAKVEGATSALDLKTPPPSGSSAGFQYVFSALEVETIFQKPQQ